MDFLQSIPDYSFLYFAVLGGFLASISCGITGTFVVVNRIGYLAGGIAHSVLGGIGAAWFFGLDPLLGALPAAWLAAVVIGLIKLHRGEHEDTLISAVWAVGMAIGILFVSRAPGYSADLMDYLFGNILFVSSRELWIMLGLDTLVLLVVLLFQRQLVAISFDDEFARLRGVPVQFFYLLLLLLVATTVVVLIQVVGLILLLALLVLPAAIARRFFNSILPIMVVSTGIGMAFTFGGLWLSWSPEFPPGATTVLLAGMTYLGIAVFSRFRPVE